MGTAVRHHAGVRLGAPDRDDGHRVGGVDAAAEEGLDVVLERHKQAGIRVVVSPVPYSEDARLHYAEGWRTAGRR